jgi:hypothetical protein
MRRTLTGVPSETNKSSYFRPWLSVAEQVVHRPGGEIAGLAADAGGGLLGRHRQAVDPGAVLGIEQHAVDRQLVGIVVGALAVLPGERHHMAVIGGVIHRNCEIDPALVAVGIGHRFAREGAACDLECLAVTGHQRQEIDEGVLLCRRIVDRDGLGSLGKTRTCQGHAQGGEDWSAEAHCRARMPEGRGGGKVPSGNHRTANSLRSRSLCKTRLEYHCVTPTAIRPIAQPVRPVLAATPVFFSWRTRRDHAACVMLRAKAG